MSLQLLAEVVILAIDELQQRLHLSLLALAAKPMV
jgi:hypothetical protein